ncbi:MAG: hypothetical protein HYY42_05165 [Chloroflexi bacterium]|nr:hypothetical protein [Chloroflexota bacterium]
MVGPLLARRSGPDVLVGKTWTQIAEAMRDPSTPLARGVIGNANWITAAICEQTGGQPASVCASPAVRSLAVR